MINKKILCSFDHGYLNHVLSKDPKRPALLYIYNNTKKIFSYIFPRNFEDFKIYKNIIKGDLKISNSKDFKRQPRFGFSGLAQSNKYIFAGSWNGIHVIKKKNFQLKEILSNKLTADIHGLAFQNKKIYTTLSFKDTLVITDLKGNLESSFTIKDDLSVVKNDRSLLKTDWRFETKQRRGPTGNFHFNHIRVNGKHVFLTSRNLGAVLKLDTQKNKIKLITIGHMSTSLIHDGKKKFDKIYFTSVDGKILIVNNDKKITKQEKIIKNKFLYKNFENSHAVEYFVINKKNLNRIPSWCRGIEILDKNRIITTVDGVYGSSGFSVVCFNTKKNKKVFEYKFDKNKELENAQNIKYTSGFDVIYI